MAKLNKINEDIRFYLPADPYYYRVDNLPLEDLLDNDKSLQRQIDSLTSAEDGVTNIGRAGFKELKPYLDTANPGRVMVNAGSFIGRAQRSSGNGIPGPGVAARNGAGIYEVNEPPSRGESTGGSTSDRYSVSNPPNWNTQPGKYVARTDVFNFKGESVAIDTFAYNDFEIVAAGTLEDSAPLARIDLIGITTEQGAMSDPYLPGNTAGGIDAGNGLPKLAVVKGAGILHTNTATWKRELVIGKRFITVGAPAEYLNDYGRDFEGLVAANPTFGTVPAPDDVVNLNVARQFLSTNMIEWAELNKNASFFLPIAYVYVPNDYVAGNPLPAAYLQDIRPFFRTAELSLPERQALAYSLSPSINNHVVTQMEMLDKFTSDINRDGSLPNIQEQLHNLVSGPIAASVAKDFQIRYQAHYQQGKTFGMQLMAINGIVFLSIKAPYGNYGGRFWFNLTNAGFETFNGNGNQSAIAFGFPHAGHDVEHNNTWHASPTSAGSVASTSWFANQQEIKLGWNMKSLAYEHDAQMLSCFAIGRLQQNADGTYFDLGNARFSN